jgi:nitroreductase
VTEISVYEAMSTLRAVRRLRPDPIPDDVLHRVLQAAVWAPSGGNTQPWRVIAVKDPRKRQALQELYQPAWQRFSAGYSKGIASLPVNEREKQERILKAGDTLADNFHLSPVILMFCYNPSLMAITDADLGRPSVVGGGSVFPAVQNSLLACRVEGLGCTITTLLCLHEKEVKQLLDIPDDWYTCAAVPIGYPVGRGHGPIKRQAVEEMSYFDTWGNTR